MGTLGGHVLPGTFFIFFGIWWSFVTSMRFILSKKKSPFKKKSLIGYKGTVTMPCVIMPCSNLRKAPIESWIKLIFSTIGLLGEVITGFSFDMQPLGDKIFAKQPDGSAGHMDMGHDHGHMDMGHDHGHMHRRDLGHDNLPNIPVKHIRFAYQNTQHITMYFAFILGSIVEILMYHKFDLPKKAPHVLGAIAFGVEAFLFANHLHSRHALDIHLHTLLVYAIEGCVVTSLLEAWKPHEVIFTYGRILFTILQGTWFYQVGFILYPPFDWWIMQWDHDDHNQIMIVTGSFCWHMFSIIIGLLLQLAVMKFAYRSSHRVRMYFEHLIEIDDMLAIEEERDAIESMRNTGEGTKFFTLISDDDEDITFDSTKNNAKEYKDKSGSSSTSGHHSTTNIV